uniref:acetyl-CoA carboxylase beta subunit n=1 Tax=Chesneya acaulis TaxID=1844621 RepID=UPI002028C3C2|nr:acetyl-CoA carboxylase beta subunit [Chesneya acaulis]UPT34355.1 acetyl-CoA carboxylase beta subunit [Chesneya acaulis]
MYDRGGTQQVIVDHTLNNHIENKKNSLGRRRSSKECCECFGGKILKESQPPTETQTPTEVVKNHILESDDPKTGEESNSSVIIYSRNYPDDPFDDETDDDLDIDLDDLEIGDLFDDPDDGEDTNPSEGKEDTNPSEGKVVSTSTNDSGLKDYSHFWVQCDSCFFLNHIWFAKERLFICEYCDAYMKMGSSARIELLIDSDTWNPMDQDMVSGDPIEWEVTEEDYFVNHPISDEEYKQRFPFAGEKLSLEEILSDEAWERKKRKIRLPKTDRRDDEDKDCWDVNSEEEPANNLEKEAKEPSKNKNSEDINKADLNWAKLAEEIANINWDEDYNDINWNLNSEVEAEKERSTNSEVEAEKERSTNSEEEAKEPSTNSEEEAKEPSTNSEEEPANNWEEEEDKPYLDRLSYYQNKTGLSEAVQTGTGQINGIPVAIAIQDFNFLGGSMGSIVGEKITRLIKYAINQRLPLIIICASGGARMQEGSLSLMQMAKIASALYEYQIKHNLFFMSILTSPTTGGVTASFGMLGDIVIAEPKAYIAFAGKRVIEDLLKIEVPEGSQSAEVLFEKGIVDAIVPRPDLKEYITELLQLHGFFPLTNDEK